MKDVNSLQIFPNPAHNVLFFQTNGMNEAAVLQITDGLGRKFKEERLTVNGNASFSIDIKDLPNGAYYFILKSSEMVQKQKFIKL